MTYLLLIVGICSPAICVVWLVRSAVESEESSLQRYVDESNEARLADAEELVRSRFNELSVGDSPERFVYPLSNERSYVVSEEATAARSALSSIRSEIADLPTEEAIRTLAMKIEAPEVAELRMLGGRLVGPILVGLAVSRAEESGSLPAELVGRFDAYVADLLESEVYSSQIRFLVERYAPFSNSAAVKLAAEREALKDKWLGELDPRTDLKDEFSTTLRTNSFLARRHANGSGLEVFTLESVFDSLAEIPRLSDWGIRIEFGNTAAETVLVRKLSGALGFLQLKMVDPVTVEDISQEKSHLYVIVGVIVLALSIVSGMAVVVSFRRQESVSRLKDDLVATVTHELKTPVSSIRLLVDTLLDEERRKKVDTSKYIELISRENQRLGALIDNFLSFSRMERAKGSFTLAPVNPAEVVQRAEEAFRERFVGQSYDLKSIVPEDLPFVLADTDAMVSALGNLLENAFKYGGSDKRILLSVKGSGAMVSFEVQDFGRGISAREQKKIFRKFYQVGEARGEHAGSVGLGLSIVDFIVSKHSGRIELESEPEKGSVFKLLIPYAQNTDR